MNKAKKKTTTRKNDERCVIGDELIKKIITDYKADGVVILIYQEGSGVSAALKVKGTEAKANMIAALNHCAQELTEQDPMAALGAVLEKLTKQLGV